MMSTRSYKNLKSSLLSFTTNHPCISAIIFLMTATWLSTAPLNSPISEISYYILSFFPHGYQYMSSVPLPTTGAIPPFWQESRPATRRTISVCGSVVGSHGITGSLLPDVPLGVEGRVILSIWQQPRGRIGVRAVDEATVQHLEQVVRHAIPNGGGFVDR